MNVATAPKDEADAITEIWAEVLGITSVQPNDNFFKLGGDSIMAMHIGEQISEKLGIYVDPILVFQFPVLNDFISEISAP